MKEKQRRWSYAGFFGAKKEGRDCLTVYRFSTRWQRDEWVRSDGIRRKITRRGPQGSAIFWRLEVAEWKNNSTEVTL